MPESHDPTPDRRRRVVAVAAVAVAVLPVLVAAVRAATGDWVPTGDDAYFTLRSLDVATEHHPLLGAWSSGSADLERNVNNLGSLQLVLLAPFTKVAPMAGTAVGVAAVHVAAIATIAWIVRRIAGLGAVVPAMAAVSILTWVMGSEMLITPRQHQYLLLTYLCVLVAAWAATAGDRWALVPFVAASSLAVQTHLSYPILVAALAVPVVAGQIAAARADGVARFRTPWLTAAAVAALLWLQTAIDQIAGWGNLRAVLASPGETEAAGFATGLRIVAEVLVSPRAVARPGYATFDPNASVAGDARMALFLVVWAALGVAAGLTFAERGRSLASTGLAVAFVAVSAAVVDAAQLPVTVFGLTAFNYRWLWPTATFLVLGSFLLIHRVARPPDPRVVPAAFGALLVVVSVANLPESRQVPNPELYADRVRQIDAMADQLDDVDLTGPVVIDQSRMYFGHPFAYPVAVVLRERGLEYRFEGEMQGRRFGESRVADGTEPTRLVLRHGEEAAALAGRDDVVVFVDGIGPLAIQLEVVG